MTTPDMILRATMAPDPYARQVRGLRAVLARVGGVWSAWVEDPFRRRGQGGVPLSGQGFGSDGCAAVHWFARTVLSGAAGGLPGDRPLSRVRLDRLQRAADIVARVRANVDDFYADRIDFDTFSARAREAWAPSNADRRLHAVTAAVLRDDWTDAVAMTDYRAR